MARLVLPSLFFFGGWLAIETARGTFSGLTTEDEHRIRRYIDQQDREAMSLLRDDIQSLHQEIAELRRTQLQLIMRMQQGHSHSKQKMR